MKGRGAFTLVELLVSVTITLILVALLGSIVGVTLGAWRQGRNQLDTYSSARQILLRIGDELKGAVANPSVSGSQIQFLENSSLGAVAPPIAGTAENVFFVAPYPNLGAGDLCAIAYSLDPITHQLKRAFRSSDQVWADAAANRYQAGGHTYTATDWHVIALGVLEFELKCYSQNDLNNNVDPPASTWDSVSGSTDMAGKAPRRIVVRLKIVDDRTLTQLTAMTPGSTTYDAVVLRAARQFSADVLLPPP